MALPNDHLTRKLVRRQFQEATPLYELLSQLTTDSTYTYRDDFDRGLNEHFWSVDRKEGVSEFSLNDEDQRLEATTTVADNSYASLNSVPIWTPRKRCAVQARIDLSLLTTVKFEVGFIAPSIEPGDVSGGVLVKDTPTALSGVGGLTVLCLDTDDDTNCDLIHASRGTVQKAVQTGPVIATPGPFTLLISMTENGDVNAWIAGQHVAKSQIAPKAVTATYGTSEEAEEADHSADSAYHLWFFVQSRAANAPRDFRIDYVQAWQDRRAVNTDTSL